MSHLSVPAITPATWVFLSGLFGIVYVLALYPIGLAIACRSRKSKVIRAPLSLPVTIILPVRNGDKWIASKLESLLSSDYPAGMMKILVVSDGSTDRTTSVVSTWPDSRVELLEIEPSGKATAINRALEHATGDIIVFTDVRQRFHPSSIATLISCFADPHVGVVTGELIITEGASQEEANTGLYWKYEKWIRRNLNVIDAMLGATGAIYAVRRALVSPLPPDTLLDDVHIPLSAALAGHSIYFECDAKAYDIPTGLQSEFKRKVRTQAGIYQIMRRFPKLLWPGNRRFLHFASHKLGRLALPFFLLLMLAGTPFLPSPLRMYAVIGQVLFYGSALIDPLLGATSPLKRFTAITRTFLVLVAAAFCALKIFILPPQKLWQEARSPAPQEPKTDSKIA